MDKQELKNKIIEVMDRGKIGSLATIKDNKPWVRYMVFGHDQGLTCYTTSFAGSRKVDQVKKDVNVHVSMGADPANYSLPYINIQAKAEVSSDLEIKKRCWSDELSKFFKGPDDPGYVVIVIKPSVIEYMSPGSMQPEVYSI